MSDNFPENNPESLDSDETRSLSRQDQIKFARERVLDAYNALNHNIARARAIADAQSQRSPFSTLIARLTGGGNVERVELDRELLLNQKLLLDMFKPVMQSVCALEEVVRQQETLIQYQMSSLQEVVESTERLRESFERESVESIQRPENPQLPSTLWSRLIRFFVAKQRIGN